MQNIAKTRNNPGLHQQLVRPCPAGSGQEVGGRAGRTIPDIFIKVALVFSQKMWYNKVVIPNPSISNNVKGMKVCRHESSAECSFASPPWSRRFRSFC